MQGNSEERCFSNCNLVDFDTGQIKNVTLCVSNGKISKICENDVGKAVDLGGALVFHGFRDCFGKALPKNSLFVEDIAEFEESDFSKLSQLAGNFPLFLKVGQDLFELGSIDKKFNKPLSYVLEDFGILDKNHVTIVGGNCFEKEDFEVFQKYDVDYVTCPAEDLFFGRPIQNLVMIKNLGIDVGIGSGKAPYFDIFECMRQILGSQWALLQDKTCLDEKDVLKMAGASTLNTGDDADFVAVRFDAKASDDAFRTLVWEKSNADFINIDELGEKK